MDLPVSRVTSDVIHVQRFDWTGQQDNYEPVHAILFTKATYFVLAARYRQRVSL
jgi:hypothetical protein